MNTGTVKSPVRVILDTNILVSALVFGGNPVKVLLLALNKRIQVITSPILLSELTDIISKKFPLSLEDMQLLEKEMKKKFVIVHPSKILSIVRDEDDNRVLEVAVEGKCDVIVTGDEDLLELGHYKNIKIMTPSRFLNIFS